VSAAADERLLGRAARIATVLGKYGFNEARRDSDPPELRARRLREALEELGPTFAKLGQILVDGKGITVYLFVHDTGTASTCYTSCAQVWPPVLTSGPPQAGTGATASLLGTTTRTDGKVEVTYAGHPLYYFVSDKQPGDATGQGIDGFGGLWWVLTPSGAAMH